MKTGLYRLLSDRGYLDGTVITDNGERNVREYFPEFATGDVVEVI